MKKIFTLLSVFLFPVFVFAQTTTTGVIGILGTIRNIINVIIPILIAAAVAWFIFGVVKYVVAKDEGLKAEGRNTMISSIIGLFVIVSVWGLVAVVSNTFGVGRDNAPVNPGNLVPTSSIDKTIVGNF